MNFPLVLALPLALVLAGCVGSPPTIPVELPAAVPLPTCGARCAIDTGPGSETSVAINPLDPDHILVVANSGAAAPPTPVRVPIQGPGWATISVRSSRDGGANWASVAIPYSTTAPATSAWSRFCVTADPVVLFDAKGVPYLFGLGWTCTNAGTPASPVQGLLPVPPILSPSYTAIGHVWMATSPDGGATWSEPLIVHRSPGIVEWPDKEWAALDPGTGRIAVAWLGISPFNPATNAPVEPWRLRFSLSADQGRSWSEPTTISDSAREGRLSQFAPVPVFDAKGLIHVAFRGCGGTCVRVATSPDGAAWTIADVAPVASVSREGSQRVPMWLPAIAYDSATGRLVVAWHGASSGGDADAYLSWSRDAGTTWSPPATLNDNPAGDGTDQFLPWIAARGDGTVDAFFYDRRDAPDNARVRATYAQYDLGTGRLLNAAAGPTIDPDPRKSGWAYYGDYEGMAAADDRAVLSWTQLSEQAGFNHVYASVFRPG